MSEPSIVNSSFECMNKCVQNTSCVGVVFKSFTKSCSLQLNKLSINTSLSLTSGWEARKITGYYYYLNTS